MCVKADGSFGMVHLLLFFLIVLCLPPRFDQKGAADTLPYKRGLLKKGGKRCIT
jgi:hypothetical protein